MNKGKTIEELKNVLEKVTAAETPDKAQQAFKAARRSIIWAELEGYSKEVLPMRQICTDYECYRRQHTR